VGFETPELLDVELVRLRGAAEASFLSACFVGDDLSLPSGFRSHEVDPKLKLK
jgi:hypothetical protein